MGDREKPRVLMVGPGRNVKGGITTVVNNYFKAGLDRDVDLKYIETMKDGNKVYKLIVAICSYIKYSLILKNYDIVHIHMAAQASFYRKSFFIKKAYRKGKRIIIHQHAGKFDTFYKELNNKKKQKIISVFKMADAVLVLSEEWYDFFSANICDGGKIHIIYNGVFLPSTYSVRETSNNVLFMGKLVREKGIYDLISIIPNVLEELPNTQFFLCGDGDVEECRKVVFEKRISNNVTFMGWIGEEQKEKLLKNTDLFVLPSYYEGMPMALLESMSYGIASIATEVGGIPQIIRNGVTGIILRPGDNTSLEDNVRELLKNFCLRNNLGSAGRKQIEDNFSIDRSILLLEEIYFIVMKASWIS